MASRKELTVGPNMLGDAVEGALRDYSRSVVAAVNAASRDAAESLVRETRATAPRGHRKRGRYASSISSRLLRTSPAGDTYVWYVKKPNYRLSHLLERGHRKVGRGSGTTKAYRFIEKARERVARDYERDVRKAVGGAS